MKTDATTPLRTPVERARAAALERRSKALSTARLVRRATRLGWVSVGLGLAGLGFPRGVARAIGVRGGARNATLLRGVGARELAAGLGILSRRRMQNWVWAEVAGSVIDVALLGRITAAAKRGRPRAGAITAAIAGLTVLDALTAVQLVRDPQATAKSIEVRRAITVNRNASDVYRHWRNLSNLPRFMTHLESVTVRGPHSTWRAKAPMGTIIEWKAVVTDDLAGEVIAWRSLPGADVPNRGSVRFRKAPGNRGTEVHVQLDYDVPGGALGATVAKLFGDDPGQQLEGDLRRFKQLMEFGEILEAAPKRVHS